jgi:hypothetical protein
MIISIFQAFGLVRGYPSRSLALNEELWTPLPGKRFCAEWQRSKGEGAHLPFGRVKARFPNK